MAALTREELLRNACKHLAKRVDAKFFGQVTIDFQNGFAVMARDVQQRKLEHSAELDGVSDARLGELLAGS